MLQRFFKGFGQNGSTLNTGAPFASTTWFRGTCVLPMDAVSARTQNNPTPTADVLMSSFLVLTGLPSCFEKSEATLSHSPDGRASKCLPQTLDYPRVEA
jgi:hypothetical protein